MADQPEKPTAAKLEHAINVVCEFVWRRRLPKLPALLAQALLDAAKDDLESQLPTDDEAAARVERLTPDGELATLHMDLARLEAALNKMSQATWYDRYEREETQRSLQRIRSALAKAREAVRG